MCVGCERQFVSICSTSSVGVKSPVGDEPFMAAGGLLLFSCVRMAAFCPGVRAGMDGTDGFRSSVELVRRLLVQRQHLGGKHQSRCSLRSEVAWGQARVWPRVVSQGPLLFPVSPGRDGTLHRFMGTPQLASVFG